MELYFIRHGIAEERTNLQSDQQRHLTEEGYQKTTQVTQKILKLGIKFDLILSSPLIRAKETADIFAKIGLSKNIEIFEALAPDGKMDKFISWIQDSLYNKPENKIALIGHQPDLANWAEKLLWKEKNDQIILKKAGIIGLKLDFIQHNNFSAKLFLLTSPKWML